MDALDLRHVDAASGIADQERARHVEARHRLPAAGGDRSSAGGDDLAALEEGLHGRMMFELLERLERGESRVLVIESDDESDIGPVAVEMIDEAAAVGAGIERPAERVLDET